MRVLRAMQLKKPGILLFLKAFSFHTWQFLLEVFILTGWETCQKRWGQYGEIFVTSRIRHGSLDSKCLFFKILFIYNHKSCIFTIVIQGFCIKFDGLGNGSNVFGSKLVSFFCKLNQVWFLDQKTLALQI